jgi:prophage regulatory protein
MNSRVKHQQAAHVTQAHVPVNALVRIGDVFDRLSVRRTQLYALINSGRFPPPIKLGRASRWLASDLDAFVIDVAASSRSSPGQSKGLAQA